MEGEMNNFDDYLVAGEPDKPLTPLQQAKVVRMLMAWIRRTSEQA